MKPGKKSFIVLLKFTFLLQLTGIVLPSLSQTPHIDSLLVQLKTMPDDTNKINLLSELIKSYMVELNNIDKVSEYAIQELALAQKLNFKRGIAVGIFYKGFARWSKGDYTTALVYYKKALRIMTELNNKRAMSYCYLNIGQTYSDMGNFPEALKYMLDGLKVKEELKDIVGLEVGYNNIGNVYMTQGDYASALKFYLKSLKLAEDAGHKLVASYCYINIGSVSSSQNKPDEALAYFKKAAKIQEELGDKAGAGSSYTSIGNIYFSRKQYRDALTYHLKDLNAKDGATDRQGMAIASNLIGNDYFALNDLKKAFFYQKQSFTLSEQMGFKKGLVPAAGGIGNVYEQKKQYQKAIQHYEKMLEIAKEIDFKEGVRDAYGNLASVYGKLKQLEQAFKYTQLYHDAKDTLLNKDNFKQVAELNTRFETDKKEKEILLLTKDQELNEKIIKQQQLVRWGLIGGLALLLISIISIFRRYRFKQKANVILEMQKAEIHQKNILITDSIDYAKTIQEAVLPTAQHISNTLSQSFILYKPKAIVSGDFYWLNKVNDLLICAVADCTGHGVPGAFMSLLGYNMLENVIKKLPLPEPAIILEELHQEVLTRLSTDDEEKRGQHGMDISLIAIDIINNRLHFAGAHNSLYIVRAGELIELKADRAGIGELKKNRKSFTNQSIDLMKNDMIYLFTDGFPDQIGGPNRKKFYYPPFKELLASISTLDLLTQKEKLNEVHTTWAGDKMEQTDDILIMGIRY